MRRKGNQIISDTLEAIYSYCEDVIRKPPTSLDNHGDDEYILGVRFGEVLIAEKIKDMFDDIEEELCGDDI